MATAMNRNTTAAEDEPELVVTNPTMANLINALIVSVVAPMHGFPFLQQPDLFFSLFSSPSDFLASYVSTYAGGLLRGDQWRSFIGAKGGHGPPSQ